MRTLKINTEKPAGIVSPLLRGACMEDVNHELYGGIWSQMIFGEAFEEPAPTNLTCGGLSAYGGTWDIADSTVICGNEPNGPKLIFENADLTDGTVSAKFTLKDNGLAGFICRVSEARNGSDAFIGYEIAVGGGIIRLAKHRHNYENLRDVPCDVKSGDAVTLTASLRGGEITVSVDGKEYLRFTDDDPIKSGKSGLRSWNCGMEVSDITLNGVQVEIPRPEKGAEVSSMWLPLSGGADSYRLENGGYSGSHSQVIKADGKETGIYNRGLNRSGMYFARDREYRGYLYIKSDKPAEVTVSLRNADCTIVHASSTFTVSGDWKKYGFVLTPDAEEINGSFAVTINSGEISLGYAFLEPGEWGLYKGMHARRDVGEALEHMGIKILRFGGCMANAKEYRWKKMTGEPENRAPYPGWWYPYSSYGFGILEFIELCEKLDVECVPDFNGYETEDDMRDFARYALGTDESDEWVKLRKKSSHPEPYRLKYIQFGNEEVVNEDFADRFIAACRGVWSVVPEITMVAGDFDYKLEISDPYDLPYDCTASHITTLKPHERILRFASEMGQAGHVYFDIHWWSEHGTTPLPFPKAAWSLHETLTKLVPESLPKLCVYELNANAHDFERGMANAYSIFSAMNHSEILPCMCSANCLQVDGQNDNDWNQGLLFMNNRSVWYQPAGLVDILLEKAWLPERLSFNEDFIDPYFNAAVMADGSGKISVCLLNRSSMDEEVEIELPALSCKRFEYVKTVLSAAKGSANTAERPDFVAISEPEKHEAEGKIVLVLGADSIMTLAIMFE